MYKVVIVEDEELILRGLMYSIPWADIDCVVVGQGRNGEEGVEQIRLHQPDIVIADINMPIMSGTDMLRETYAECCYSAIILSSYSSFDYAKSAMEAGAVRYLLKPVKRQELFEALEKAKEQCGIRRTWLAHKKEQGEWRALRMELTPTTDTEPDAITQAMLDYAEQNYKGKVTLQDVSDKLNYSIAFLNRTFKKQMGTTFIEYLNRLRIQKAMELIKTGEVPLHDISWQCGIGEYKYFKVVFKKYVGCSPREYAEKVGSWLQ